METSETIESKITKPVKTLSTTPEYFGAYLNMARLNIFNINNHLAEKFGASTLRDEGEIPNSFLVPKINKNQTHIFSQLKKFMPIARVFDDETLPKFEQENLINKKGKDINQLSESLAFIFKELNEFRNDYTHYYSTNSGIERKLKISNQLSDFLNENFIRAILHTKERFKDVYTEEDFSTASKTIIVNEDKTITQDGIVFLISIFLDRENAFQFINKIKYLKGTQNKMFTAKRETLSAFCIKLPHEKFISENPTQAFSLELINELNKCPKTLYNVITEEEKKAFQPELGDEELENIYTNSIPETIDDYESYIESITKRVRNNNRFSYFAMRFLDEKEIFPKLRFQIDLGKVIIAEYNKTLDGNQELRKVVENVKAFGRLQDFRFAEETILNRINTSIKTEFEQFSPHYNFEEKIGKIGINLAREDTAKFLNRPKSEKKVTTYLKQPEVEAFLSVHDLPKIILLEYLEKGKTESIINDFININKSKILNLEFIEIIKSKLSHLNEFNKRSQGRKQETTYHDKTLNDLHQRKKELNQILAEHGLNDKQIPSRISDYWLNITDVQEKIAISDRVKLMKRDCIDRLKAIQKGKAPKIGEMATFLAKDIIDMIIDEDKKQKITSFYYDKIQECLALFADEEKKNILIKIINELLLNQKGGHPFLNKIDFSSFKYTSDIYKTYLQEKGQKLVSVFNPRSNKYIEKDQSWLQNNFYVLEWNENAKKNLTVVKIPSDVSKLPFSIRKLERKKSSFEQWFKYVTKGKENNDRKKPIDLPTNLFDEVLKELLSTKLKDENILLDENANYNQLFKLWWEKYRKDSVQDFYHAEREYIFENKKLNFTINSKEKFEDYYKNEFLDTVYKLKQAQRTEDKKKNRKLPDIVKTQVEKSIRNKIGKTEKEIRILQEEDRLMLLMFEQLVNKENLEPKLKNIEILLNESLLVKEKITGRLLFDDLGEIIEKDKEKKHITKHITENRKRKEYSVLKKYIFDRRLPELFEYFNEECIPIEKIKLELDSYNKAKETVFELIFELEKTIITKVKDSIINLHKQESKEGNKEGNVSHKPYLSWLLLQNIITEKDFRFMNMVRKSFSHNQFPQKKTMEIHIKKWTNGKYAQQIVEIYKEMNVEILTQIK
jgi:hypothetical protein